MTSVKCTVIGELAGKTALIQVFTQEQFPTDFTPTVFGMDSRTLELDNEEILVNIWDTSCQESFEELRKQASKGSDVIILAFSINGYIEHIEQIWMKEIERNFPEGQSPPIVLVGTMVDLRGEERRTDDRRLTTYKDGVVLAKKIGAKRYMECSAKKDPQSCRAIFEAAVREALKKNVTSPPTALSFSCFKTVSSQLDDQR